MIGTWSRGNSTRGKRDVRKMGTMCGGGWWLGGGGGGGEVGHSVLVLGNCRSFYSCFDPLRCLVGSNK